MAAPRTDDAIAAEISTSSVTVPWCDEFRRMVTGEAFAGSRAPEMAAYKLQVKRKLQEFNNEVIADNSTMASLTARRMAVAKEMMGSVGLHTNIETPFFLTWGCNTFIGDNVYMNRGVSIYDNSLVRIGDRVLIGPDVCICTGTHDVDWQARRDSNGTSFALPIQIDEDCWIGARAVILPGVHIGRGSTVAAGAVVTRDVEAECVVGGVPAKLLRRLNSAEHQKVTTAG